MSSAQLSRVGGLALLIGAITFVVHIILRSLVTAGVEMSTVASQGLWVPINALGLVGALLVLLGLPALYPRVATASGWLGVTGIMLTTVAWVFFGLFLSLYAILLVPWLAAEAPSLIATGAPLPMGMLVTYMVGLILWLVGAILLAIPFIRGRLLPRWVGYLLLVAGLWMVVGNLVIAPSGPASNLAINLLSNLGPVLLMVAVGYLGWRTWTEQALTG